MKILLVHKNMFYREGLRYLIRQIDVNIVFIEAANFNQMLNLGDMHLDLSLVLVSLKPADGQGTNALERLCRSRPNLPIVVIYDGAEDDAATARFIEAGARGVLAKPADKALLSKALSAVLSGDIPTTPSDAVPPSQMPNKETVGRPKRSQNTDGGSYYLTPRKWEVLTLLKHGKSNKEIAKQLRLSEATVKTYCLKIYRELGVTNRTQAAIKAKLLLQENRSDGEEEQMR